MGTWEIYRLFVMSGVKGFMLEMILNCVIYICEDEYGASVIWVYFILN